MLNIGITSRSYSGLTICDAALDMAGKGFKCTELCFTHPELPGWTYNGIGSLEGITPKKVREMADEFRHRGVDVTSLGMFTDLRSPDKTARDAAVDYTRRYVEFAAEAGIPYIASVADFRRTPTRATILI